MTLSLKNTIFAVCLCGFTAIATTCGQPKNMLAYEASYELSQKEVLTFLASDDMEGREVGEAGGIKAAEYVKTQMELIGLTGKGDNGTFFQDFSFQPISVNPHGSATDMGLGQSEVITINGKNVIGQIDNGKEYTIIIGAHYDHLGYGNEFSLFKGDSAIHNGADDNASGVVAMLKLANKIKNYPQFYSSFNFVFMAFSGEEYGLMGSNHFCKNPTLDLKKVNCMLNFDMVGRLKEDKSLAVYGNGTSPAWTDLVNDKNGGNFKLVFEESGVGPSDHTSFYLVDIPVLHFFTGQHEDYHKPSDDVEDINFEGLAEVTDFVSDIVLALQPLDKLPFTKTKDSSAEEMSFKVTLGVVPDYMYAEEGMRIDGVSEGRPAANAGMQKGDVVIMMGENPVKDMMGYMECLGKFEEGQTTVVRVKRGEEELDLDVTWD
ncbi:MAG: M28 family peptidase [Flavobacteriales bacterium]